MVAEESLTFVKYCNRELLDRFPYFRNVHSHANSRMRVIITILGDNDAPVLSNLLAGFLCNEFPGLSLDNARMSFVRLKRDGLIEHAKKGKFASLVLTPLGRKVYDEISSIGCREMEKESK